MDRDFRVCIVGAGAAGISAAVRLRERGFRQVVVIEAEKYLGGKCKTVRTDGLPLDRGAVFYFANYPTLKRLGRSVGFQHRPAPRLQHLDADGKFRFFGDATAGPPFLDRVAEYARFAGKLWRVRRSFLRELGGLSDVDLRELATPLSVFMARHRLHFFQEVIYPLMRSFGFGFEEQEVPALYLVKALPQLVRLGNLRSVWDLSRLEIDQVEGGYGLLWQRLCEQPKIDVRLDTVVLKIERTLRGGVIKTTSGELPFDALILACPLKQALSRLDASAEEQTLFGAIRTIPVWQCAARITGKDVPRALLFDRNQAFARRGRPMIMVRYQPDADWVYLFGYQAAQQTAADIADAVREEIELIGGHLAGTPEITLWPDFFPHYDSMATQAGYHARIERLQGQRATYYAGEIVANLGVESAAAYAQRLIDRFFPLGGVPPTNGMRTPPFRKSAG